MMDLNHHWGVFEAPASAVGLIELVQGVRLELTEAEAGGFTIRSNCRYANPDRGVNPWYRATFPGFSGPCFTFKLGRQ